MMLRLALLFAVLTAGLSAQIAIVAKEVHPVSGAVIENGVVLVENGKIRAVGPAASTPIPSGWRTIEAHAVTPGLIDAHSVVGLAGYLNQPTDSDHVDRSTAMQPELRALDAYNSRERLVRWVRELGVTTLHTGHAPIALIPGQTMLAKTLDGTADAVSIRDEAMVSVVLGEAGQGMNNKSPGNRSKAVAMLRGHFTKAREYARKQANADVSKRPARDLGLEVLVEALAGRRPVLVTAQRARDIQTALRLAKEFGFKMILDGVADAHLMIPELKAAGHPIIIHPTMVRSNGDMGNAAMTTAAKLAEADIPFAFQSGYEGYVPKTRVVLFEAAVAIQHGLSRERALRALTHDAAKILGIADRTGTLEVGKDADIACFDGDPFETVTRCTTVLVNGTLVSESPR